MYIYIRRWKGSSYSGVSLEFIGSRLYRIIIYRTKNFHLLHVAVAHSPSLLKRVKDISKAISTVMITTYLSNGFRTSSLSYSCDGKRETVTKEGVGLRWPWILSPRRRCGCSVKVHKQERRPERDNVTSQTRGLASALELR